MPEAEFSTSLETTERCAVVSVVGEIDVATVPSFRERLSESLGSGLPTLVIDMLGTTFIDSTGLGALIDTKRQAESVGTTLRVVASDPRLLKVFAITGLAESFDIRSSREEAIAE